ncbi:hypothetical protein LCM20_02980 [Halobacillus litoralis]|uniref:hypothetical protein n=1 Tax=Halobacillus litoralis TaxID=45668 RepID=UPI001CD3E82B|nr:hypothetical protein [Halobacillus litoralis]MCA0969555.1 hypothetical protein [Halobacillus litoralis]
MNVDQGHLRQGVENRRFSLVTKLEAMGYTEDRLGKKTTEMTLTELEQIYINVSAQTLQS